jgi:hypothetical protein
MRVRKSLFSQGMQAVQLAEEKHITRQTDLKLAHEFANCPDNDVDRVREVLVYIETFYQNDLLDIIFRTPLVGQYFESLDQLHSTGIMEEVYKQALRYMYLEPNWYVTLVDYFPDALVAVMVFHIGDSQMNLLGSGWDANLFAEDLRYYHISQKIGRA